MKKETNESTGMQKLTTFHVWAIYKNILTIFNNKKDLKSTVGGKKWESIEEEFKKEFGQSKPPGNIFCSNDFVKKYGFILTDFVLENQMFFFKTEFEKDYTGLFSKIKGSEILGSLYYLMHHELVKEKYGIKSELSSGGSLDYSSGNDFMEYSLLKMTLLERDQQQIEKELDLQISKRHSGKLFREHFFLDEKQQLEKWLEPKSIQLTELLYKASEHCFSPEEFHKRVDEKQCLFALIITEKNKRFGMFLNTKFSPNTDAIDLQQMSFLFTFNFNGNTSINKIHKAMYKLSKDSINLVLSYDSDSFFKLGSDQNGYNYDLIIEKNTDKSLKGKCSSDNINTKRAYNELETSYMTEEEKKYLDSINNKPNALCGAENFIIKELKVFQASIC